MKNIIHDRPRTYNELHGRLKYSCDFVRHEDLVGKKVLNIGCGFGWFELFAVSQEAHSSTGMEYSDADLATAKKHIQDPRINLVVGSATDLPFEDGTFDTVVSWEVLEHIPKKTERRMFEEVSRVLKKPGGAFYLSTPFRSPLSTYMDPAWWLIGHRHYRKSELAQYYSGLFDSQRLELKGGPWEVASWWNLYISKWIFRRAPFVEKWFNHKLDIEFNGRPPPELMAANIFAHWTTQ